MCGASGPLSRVRITEMARAMQTLRASFGIPLRSIGGHLCSVFYHSLMWWRVQNREDGFASFFNRSLPIILSRRVVVVAPPPLPAHISILMPHFFLSPFFRSQSRKI